jgi:hypothetical protein
MSGRSATVPAHPDELIRPALAAHRDEQAELIEARIRRGLDLAANAEVLPRGKTREDFGCNHIFGAVMEVAPLCKHPDFAEEREWRLLFGPVLDRP